MRRAARRRAERERTFACSSSRDGRMGFALGDVSVENPGLVNFNLLSVSFSTRF